MRKGLTGVGNLGCSCTNLTGGAIKAPHDQALRTDGLAELVRDPASRQDLQNHEECVNRNGADAGLMVEDAGRQPEPEQHMMQRDGDTCGYQRGDTSKDSQHGNQDENLEVRFYESAA